MLLACGGEQKAAERNMPSLPKRRHSPVQSVNGPTSIHMQRQVSGSETESMDSTCISRAFDGATSINEGD